MPRSRSCALQEEFPVLDHAGRTGNLDYDFLRAGPSLFPELLSLPFDVDPQGIAQVPKDHPHFPVTLHAPEGVPVELKSLGFLGVLLH
jgi:hypothetical protein